MNSMNSSYYDFLFAELKKHLLHYSIYSPTVLKKPMLSSPKYPQVVLSEISNSNDSTTIDRMQVIDVLGYEVEIFSTNLVIGGKTVDNLVVCREIAHIADKLLFAYGLRRISKTPAPNVDTTLHRIILRYNGKMFNNYNQIL